jgi:hypothetical protein
MPHLDIHSLWLMLTNLLHAPAVSDMSLVLPWHWSDLRFERKLLLWGILAAPVIAVLCWKKNQPAVSHTRLPRTRASVRGLLTILMLIGACGLTGVGVASLVTAVARPDKIEIQNGGTVMVRDLHFAFDISQGNMNEDIGSEAHSNPDDYSANPDRGNCGTQADWGTRKIDASAYAACKIAQAFPNDRKSMSTFSGSTQCCAPALTTSQQFFDQRLRYINQQFGDSDTNYEDDQGVFHVMLDFIKERGKSRTQVLIVFTDGDGTMTDEHIQKFVNELKERHTFLICAGPGQDTVATDPDSDALVKLCNQAGGVIANVAYDYGIQQVIDAIRALPPSEIKLDSKEVFRPVHEGFILFGFINLAIAFALFAAAGRIR